MCRPLARRECGRCRCRQIPDEPRTGQAAGCIHADVDREDIDGHPDRIEDAAIEAASEKFVKDERGDAAQAPDGGDEDEADFEDAEPRADQSCDRARRVDEEVTPLQREVETAHAFAGCGVRDVHGVERLYAVLCRGVVGAAALSGTATAEAAVATKVLTRSRGRRASHS